MKAYIVHDNIARFRAVKNLQRRKSDTPLTTEEQLKCQRYLVESMLWTSSRNHATRFATRSEAMRFAKRFAKIESYDLGDFRTVFEIIETL